MTEYEEMKHVIKERVLKKIDFSSDMTDQEIEELIDEEILSEGRKKYLTLAQKSELGKELFFSIRRLDILQDLIVDDSVTEIMVNGPKDIFIERDGKLMRYDRCFESREKLEDVIQQIIAASNRVVNEAMPIVDARLENGARVNVVLNPVALNGPILTIRRFPSNPILMKNLLEFGSITEEAADFLKKLVKAGYNIFISGDNVIIGLSPSDFRKRGSHGGLVHICLRR